MALSKKQKIVGGVGLAAALYYFVLRPRGGMSAIAPAGPGVGKAGVTKLTISPQAVAAAIAAKQKATAALATPASSLSGTTLGDGDCVCGGASSLGAPATAGGAIKEVNSIYAWRRKLHQQQQQGGR